MLDSQKDKIIFFLTGILVGIVITSIGAIAAYKIVKGTRQDSRYAAEKVNKKSIKKAAPLKEFYLSFEKKSDLGVFGVADNLSFELSQDNATHGRNSLMVKFAPGPGYPGPAWEVYGKEVQDWSQAKDFHCDVYNNSEDYVPLIVKLKSGRKYPKKSFSRSFKLEPLKLNQIKIPIEDIAYNCDVTEISYLKIFVSSPAKEIVLFFDNIGTRYGEPLNSSAQVEQGSFLQEKPGFPNTTEEGFSVFVASSLDRIFQDGKTLLRPTFSDSAAISLAKNEYEHFQVVIINGSKLLKSVQIDISDLVNEKTQTRIDRRDISWRVVEYVRTKKPYYQVKFVGLWPDPLMPAEPTDIAPGLTQPFWVTIYIPQETPAGIYRGSLAVRAENHPLVPIPLAVKVFDFSLPRESRLKTAFDFYPHVTAIRYPQKEKETKQAYAARISRLNEQYIKDMLKHRINPILNIDPLSPSDLGRIDKYRKYGLNNFSIGKRGGTFNNNWPKSDEQLEKLFTVYRTYGENLKINKMMDYHYIYTWDEGEIGNPQVAKITAMIHRAHPELKNMVCYHGFWDPDTNPQWGKDIDIWCFGIGDFIERSMRKLERLGMEMWMYVSGPGSSGEPNLAIDFDSIDYRIIPWLCWKYDIKGFLYWCVNWWPYVNPFESASNTKWNQNGNGLLFYPHETGPIASLRLEIFRDGMEDYEYLAILKDKVNLLEKSNLKIKYPEVYKKSISLLTVDQAMASSMRSFTKDNQVLFQRRKEIAKMIETIDGLSQEIRN